MSDELLAHLRNADIGICDEAADEIERLRAQVAELLELARDLDYDLYGEFGTGPYVQHEVLARYPSEPSDDECTCDSPEFSVAVTATASSHADAHEAGRWSRHSDACTKRTTDDQLPVSNPRRWRRMSGCSLCGEPLLGGQEGRHALCAPMCVECGASVDSKPYPKHKHRTNGQSWHLVLAWAARRLAPPTPVRWWTPGLYDEIDDEFEVGL